MITPIKPYLIGGVVLSVVLFLGAFYLRGLALDRCEATIAQIEELGQRFKADADEAVKELQERATEAERHRLRALREINQNDKNNAPSPAIVDAIRLLCNQGAACGNSTGVDGS